MLETLETLEILKNFPSGSDWYPEYHESTRQPSRLRILEKNEKESRQASEFFSPLTEKYITRVSRFLPSPPPFLSLSLFHEPLYHEQIGKLRGVTSLQDGEGG